MTNDFFAVSDGTFTLSETENKNQFYFYRNDGGILKDVGSKPQVLYQTYIIHKMMNDDTIDTVMHNIDYETSNDGRCIKLTIDNSINEKVSKTITMYHKDSSFLKRLFHKIFD